MRALLRGEHQANDGCEQRDTFDEGREDQGRALDRVSGFRLAGDTFAGCATDATDAETGTNSSETSGKAGTDTETGVRGRSELVGGVLEESKHWGSPSKLKKRNEWKADKRSGARARMTLD
ncbi:MAG: hypothetical protein ACI89X_004052 [Planctomycetota bacterium]|jgi:hypothetical protein